MQREFRTKMFDQARDLQRVADFLVAARSQVGPCGFYHLGDLSWNLYLQNLKSRPTDTFRLWEDVNGDLVGFAMIYLPGAVDIQAAPWLANRSELEQKMLDWGEEFIRERPQEAGKMPRLSVEAFEKDRRFLCLLDENGFFREGEHKLHMLWDLSNPVPSHILPAGYAVRPIEAGDLSRRGDLQRSVWPWSLVGEETYHQLQAMPGYRPELDLLAIAPSGKLASFALCWYDEVNRVGEFEPVGTNPEFRGLGLAKATLLEALRILKQMGARECVVYPPGDEVAALRLYESAGFAPLQRCYVYSKELPPR